MALLLRPANVQKNVAASFTLDLAELSALPAVPAGYYKNTDNWKEIYIKVKHSASGQHKEIVYKLPSVVSPLLLSDTARAGVWQIESIMIRDFDRGEVVLRRADIPSVEGYDFIAVSSATHGDLIVANGQTYTLPANADRQYGDLVVESGGTLLIGDGGGIAVLDVLGNCVINGTIKGSQGKHTGGTFTKVSPLGETLTHVVTQPEGGNGGQGEETTTAGGTLREPASGSNYNASSFFWQRYNGGTFISWNGQSIGGFPAIANETATSFDFGGYTYHMDTFAESIEAFGTAYNYRIYRTSATAPTVTPGGVGGLAAFGNGGAGGRSAKFVAQAGGNAIDVNAGQGVAQASSADEYGEDGLNSTAPANTAGGGFRGAHGQGLYIKAAQIQGSGTVDFSGQKGGNGGNGGEYLSEGELYANGPGGGAAGGNGGNVWFRVKKGTPVVTVNVLGGERGTRGLASSGATEAAHGANGTNGVFSLSTF